MGLQVSRVSCGVDETPVNETESPTPDRIDYVPEVSTAADPGPTHRRTGAPERRRRASAPPARCANGADGYAPTAIGIR